MRKATVLAAAAMTIWPATAWAQDPTGSPARQAQDIVDVPIQESDFFDHRFRFNARATSEAYLDGLRFASCTVKHNEAAARALLATDAGSKEEGRQIREITRRYTNTCAVRRESMTAPMFRGVFAETLWKNAGANPNPTKRASVDIADVENFIKAKPAGDGTFKAGGGLPIYWVSRCQVMALPDQAAKVLKANPGSPEERTEATTLYNGSATCGVTKGLQSTPVAAVRAALADAFYQDGLKTKVAQNP